mmetsp:Transcript_14206/g.44172  ORF Transcript_14206/g.44172 Transcript_14206/m.44172 type:complete len:226 (-) Transcript_14206:89-766(-)
MLADRVSENDTDAPERDSVGEAVPRDLVAVAVDVGVGVGGTGKVSVGQLGVDVALADADPLRDAVFLEALGLAVPTLDETDSDAEDTVGVGVRVMKTKVFDLVGTLLGVSVKDHDMVPSSDLLRVFVGPGDRVAVSVASSDGLIVGLSPLPDSVNVAVASSDSDCDGRDSDSDSSLTVTRGVLVPAPAAWAPVRAKRINSNAMAGAVMMPVRRKAAVVWDPILRE